MNRIRIFFIIMTLSASAFASNGDKIPIYYYNLKFLKKADTPVITQMVKVDKISTGQKILSKGILFTYKNRKALNVKIGGNFNFWNPESMERSDNGVWYFFLEGERASKKIEYKINVDGIWIPDPQNRNREDDRSGSYISYLNFKKDREGKQITFRMLDKRTVEFRIFNPEARIISLVGDFNHWTPENDIMQKDSDGIWRLKKRLPAGTFKYRYIIDGEWSADLYNSKSASDSSGEVCSLITLE